MLLRTDIILYLACKHQIYTTYTHQMSHVTSLIHLIEDVKSHMTYLEDVRGIIQALIACKLLLIFTCLAPKDHFLYYLHVYLY